MRLIAGAVLIICGVALLGWALYATLNPAAHYEVRHAAAPAEDAKAFEKLGIKSEGLERYEVRAAGETGPVAEGVIARDAKGRLVPLSWTNKVTQPVFFTDIAGTDIGKVLAAIREHVPEGAAVLGWWDMSRAIRLVAGRDAPLDDGRATGLQIPAGWNNTAAQEAARWGAGVDNAATQTFPRFVDALLMDETKGADALKALAGGKPAFVAVHISDAWKVAAARPEKLALAYKDFPSATVNHGLIKSAQEWMREEKIDGPYAVEPTGGATRLHYLRKVDGDKLITRLLPFSTSLPNPPTQFELVYQHKGWWIWRLKD